MRYVLAILVAAISLPVQAATITFGESGLDQLNLAGPQVEGDYTYQAFGAGWEIYDDTSYFDPFGNPPAALVTFWNDEYGNLGDYVDLVRTDGQAFFFESLDYRSRDEEYPSQEVTITGYLSGAEIGSFTIGDPTGLTFATVNSSFGGAIDLLRLSVSGGGSATAMDNVVLSQVPVPAALWLFGSGLGILGWIRRRKAV